MKKTVYIKICDISDFSTPFMVENDCILTHVNKYYKDENKNQSLFTYNKLSLLLEEKMNKSIDDIYFLESGKPLLKNEGNISLSHSGTLSLIGCSSYPFGLDIQEIKDINYNVAKKLYKDKDVSNLSIEEYYLRWTYLEAKAKMNDSSIFDLEDEGTFSYNKIVLVKGKKYAMSIVYKDKDIVIED